MAALKDICLLSCQRTDMVPEDLPCAFLTAGPVADSLHWPSVPNILLGSCSLQKWKYDMGWKGKSSFPSDTSIFLVCTLCMGFILPDFCFQQCDLVPLNAYVLGWISYFKAQFSWSVLNIYFICVWVAYLLSCSVCISAPNIWSD